MKYITGLVLIPLLLFTSNIIHAQNNSKMESSTESIRSFNELIGT